MHNPSSLVVIIESFSDEIVQSLATYTSIPTHSFRGPTVNCPLFIQLLLFIQRLGSAFESRMKGELIVELYNS